MLVLVLMKFINEDEGILFQLKVFFSKEEYIST